MRTAIVAVCPTERVCVLVVSVNVVSGATKGEDAVACNERIIGFCFNPYMMKNKMPMAIIRTVNKATVVLDISRIKYTKLLPLYEMYYGFIRKYCEGRLISGLC